MNRIQTLRSALILHKTGEKKYKVYLFGEAHSEKTEVSNIRSKIKDINPNYILHELAEDDLEFYKSEAPKSKLIKIDCDTLGILSLRDKFKVRESHMLKKIKQYYGKGVICVVLGDTHLRTIETKELGDISPIFEWAKDRKDVKIIRSKFKEIE